MNLLLLSYNNYYNRIVKKENDVSSYLAYKHKFTEVVSFNPNDGIDTEHVVNWEEDFTPDYMIVTEQQQDGSTKIISRWFILKSVRTRAGQYKLSLHRDVIVDNYETVVNAPCFIEKATLDDSNPLIFNSEGMNFNQIKQSEILLKDESDTAWIVGYISKKGIYNNTTEEHKQNNVVNGVLNTLPSGSYIDISSRSWASKIALNKQTNSYYLENNNSISLVMGSYCSTFPYKAGMLFALNNDKQLRYRNYDFGFSKNWTLQYDLINFNNIDIINSMNDFGLVDLFNEINDCNNCWLSQNMASSVISQLVSDQNYFSASEIEDIKSIIGQPVLLNGHIVNIKISENFYEYKESGYKTSQSETGSMITLLDNFRSYLYSQTHITQSDVFSPTVNKPAYRLVYEAKPVVIEAVSVDSSTWTTTLGHDGARLDCSNASYDMFVIPYGNIIVDGELLSKENALNIAQTISQHLTSAVIYDLQLLPYLPKELQAFVKKNAINQKYFDLTDLTNVYNYSLVKTQAAPAKTVGLVLWCPSCTGKFNIDFNSIKTDRISDEFETSEYQATVIGAVTWYRATHTFNNLVDSKYIITNVFVTEGFDIPSFRAFGYINISGTGVNVKYKSTLNTDCNYELVITYQLRKNYLNIENVKLASECDTWRLCSPNYSGAFDFNIAKNGGLRYIDVDYTYKPYNPYIHVAPQFGLLYGASFGDIRGLVCGGDYSLSYISDKFAEYELQNKNYQNIFDRQIKSLDIQQNYQKLQDSIGVFTGSLQGTASGAVAGGLSGGGPIGAVIGGAVGGISSTIGGVADLMINDALRYEQRNITKDMFKYQLGNIKALPYGLAKTNAFTENNKLFPFIEYYTCTNKEREALKNKLKYDGMTVMAIGTIAEYIRDEESYIKGQIIRLDELVDNSQLANEIYKEVNKGVYI